ncbi:MAG: FecR domain-containing protein [Bacteroidota bacterium]
MTSERTHILIVKFLSDKLSKEEEQELEKLLENEGNQTLFTEMVQANLYSDYALRKFSSQHLKRKLKDAMYEQAHPVPRTRKLTIYRYAAIAIVVLGTAFAIKAILSGTYQSDEQIIPRDQPVVLELENGETQILDLSVSKLVQNGQGLILGSQEKELIRYSDSSQIEKLIYNTIKVPFGKRFDLVLSDGTKVFLNSGSSMRYPVKFLQGQTREVFLTGEAFFDVSSDENRKFFVGAEKLNVSVLGTRFMVSLYEEDQSTSVVLEEGIVELFEKSINVPTKLMPGERGVLDYETGVLTKAFVNTQLFTSWMQGVLVFRNETFANISKKLERVYNVTIISENPDFDKEVFNASFDNETIEDILSYFQDSYNMNYIIEDNIIYIK